MDGPNWPDSILACKTLSRFGVSGGVIENIAKKCIIQSNFELRDPDMTEVMEMTKKEMAFRGENKIISGFINSETA